jgi:CubicO group peptidase (beta-lactamase class C family)
MKLLTKNNGGYSFLPRFLAVICFCFFASEALHGRTVLVAWGWDGYRQVTLPNNLTNVIAVAAGGYHSLALRSDKTVIAWGAGTNNTSSNHAFGQAIVPGGLTNVQAVAAGWEHSLALKLNGTVAAWGGNLSGECNVPPNLTNVVAITAGASFSLALKGNGTVVAWGSNSYGKTNVPISLTNIVAISAGQHHSLALRNNGTVVAWGAGMTATATYPIHGQSVVPAGLTNVVNIAAGAIHSLALKGDGSIVFWGDTNLGKANVPASLNDAAIIAGGANFSLALRSNTSVTGWGYNGNGETNPPMNLTNVTALSAGGYHCLALYNTILDFGVPQDISADLESIRTNFHLPGISAMAIKQGRIVALGACGVRRQGQTTPLLVTDPINIASCTKWFTATIAGRLVDRGLISWNTRVRDLFTNYAVFNSAFHDVTLDQLLSHRSGVQQSSTFNANHDEFWNQTGTIPQIRRWVSETVLKDTPEAPPGSYLYANQGYAIAATMMELASGKDWEMLMREEIFVPLRMTTATLGHVYDNALPPKFPVGHTLAVGQTIPVPRPASSASAAYQMQASLGPGGYVICTLQEWARFLHMQATSDMNGYLSTSTALHLQQSYSGTEGYGYGVDVGNRSWATPGQALSHSGSIFCHCTVFWVAPARDFIVVVFTNCQSDDDSTSLGLDNVASLLVGRYSDSVPKGPLIETPFAITPRVTQTNFAFNYTTLPGIRYLIQSSTDLKTWSPTNADLGHSATNLQSSHIRTIENPGPGQMFFRALAIP